MFRYRIKGSISNIVILFIVALSCVGYCFYLNRFEDFFRTIVLFCIATIIIDVLSKKNEDIDMDKASIYTIYYVRLILILIFFQVGWLSSLNASSIIDGYDPARYYYFANQLIENHFVPQYGSLNYYGIVYWYALIFVIFGTNPIIPIIINNLMSIISALYILRILNYVLLGKCSKSNRKIFALYLLIPELIWFDALTSREMVCLFFLVLIFWNILKAFFIDKKSTRLVLVLIYSILLGMIRTSLLVVVALLFLLCFFTANKTSKIITKILLIAAFLVSLLLVALVSSMNGSFVTNPFVTLKTIFVNVDSNSTQWSVNSAGKYLVIDTPIKLVFLAPIRMFVYLILPLPDIYISISNLFASNYAEWEHLFEFISSILYVLGIPYIIGAILHVIACRRRMRNDFVITLLFSMVLLLAVSCGTSIIHTRYRIASIPFIIITIILGDNVQKKYKTIGILISLFVFLLGTVLYLIIKAGL